MDMLTKQAEARRAIIAQTSVSETEKMKQVLELIPTDLSQPANQLRIATFALNRLIELVAASSVYTVEELRASYVKQAIRGLRSEGFCR